jgi:hypothetical protein
LHLYLYLIPDIGVVHIAAQGHLIVLLRVSLFRQMMLGETSCNLVMLLLFHIYICLLLRNIDL